IERMTYYSSWIYTAVHMSLMIPGLDSRAAIGSYLGVAEPAVNAALEFLRGVGLAKFADDRWQAGPARLHLPAQSPLVAKHHTNWRMRAIASLDAPGETDLHYSSIMSLSREAAEKIRELLLNAIQAIEPMIREARDEGVYTLNLDLFDV